MTEDIIEEIVEKGLDTLEDIIEDEKYGKLGALVGWITLGAKKTSPEVFLLISFLMIIQYLFLVSAYVSIITGIVITIAFAKSKASENKLKEENDTLKEDVKKLQYEVFTLETKAKYKQPEA